MASKMNAWSVEPVHHDEPPAITERTECEILHAGAAVGGGEDDLHAPGGEGMARGGGGTSAASASSAGHDSAGSKPAG